MIAVDQRMIAQHVPVAEYLSTPDDAASEQQLIGRVQACFRYKDHTLEEYRAVIAALAPGAESRDVVWPGLHRNEHIQVILENPTAAPVLASVAFRIQVAKG